MFAVSIAILFFFLTAVLPLVFSDSCNPLALPPFGKKQKKKVSENGESTQQG